MAFRNKKVAVHTFGCRLNSAESGTILDTFKSHGAKIVPYGSDADYIIFNSCSVTNKAEVACRNAVRSIKKKFPQAKIIVTGCYSQLSQNNLEEISEIFLVVSNDKKSSLISELIKKENLNDTIQKNENSINVFMKGKSSSEDDRTRTFLKVQDGCEYFCAYCIIPYARGKFRSMLVNDVIQEIKEIEGSDIKEVVLTGINLGEYFDSKNKNLADLLEEILDKTKIKRIRLSSIEPNLISERLMKIISSSDRIMHHLHLPIQSASDDVLKMMGRRYSLKEYQKQLDLVLKYIPGMAIGSDIIVGFPGETKKLFDDTFNNLNNLPISHLHVFSYSPRRGTKAEAMNGRIDGIEMRRRSNQLIQLGKEKMDFFAKRFIGKTESVLFEKNSRQGKIGGYTSTYLRVDLALPTRHDLPSQYLNEIQNIQLISFNAGKFIGKI